jgi:nitrogen PTS system EIIA component
MKSLLNALQEGRLIELPESDRATSLQYLATIIEAMPDFRSGFDFAAAVASRETAAGTAIGAGWACPHGRVNGEGELACALGWSPKGIAWDSPDGKPVHIVCMHYIPDSEKNTYLKEISTLARVIKKDERMREFAAEKDLGGVRHRMLDLLTAAVDTAVPDAKVRMIQLEAKQAAAAAQGLPAELLSAVDLVPLTVVVVPGSRPTVLCQDAALTAQVESSGELAAQLAAKLPFERAGCRILIHAVRSFPPDRFAYDCLAIRPLPARPKSAP